LGKFESLRGGVCVFQPLLNVHTDGVAGFMQSLTVVMEKIFETLNLKGMQHLWGRKISDECFWRVLANLRVGCQKERQASRIRGSVVSI
jgi:hypothetical protein